MADTNPIKYSDLVQPDDSIEKLTKQLGELIITYQHLSEVVTKDASQMVASLLKASGATKQGRAEISQQSKEAEQLAKAHEQLRYAQSETAKQIAQLNVLKQKQAQANKNEAKILLSQRDSYDRLSARYAQLKAEINGMNPVTEKARKAFEAKQKAAKQLMERMNELQKATGKYVLQVGNYNIAGERMAQVIKEGREAMLQMEKAGKANSAEYLKLAQQLSQMKDQMSDTDALLKNMASDTWGLDASLQALSVGTGGFAAVTGAMSLFGAESEDVEEAQKKLQSAIALVNGVTAIQNALQKQSALVTKLKALQTAILSKFQKENTATTVANTTAIKAQGVATETTTKATKGLGAALNAIKSNPIILALSLLVGLGVATVAVVKRVQSAQKRAYEQQLKDLEAVEAAQKKSQLAREKEIEETEQAIKLAQAEGKSADEILKLREQQLETRTQMQTRNNSFYASEIDNLEKNKRKLAENEEMLKKEAAGSIKLRGYKIEEIKAENELLTKQIEIGEQQIEQNNDLIVQAAQLAEERRQLAIETAKAEEDSLRTLEDARNNLIKNQFNRERTITQANYDRQIADLKARLVNEKNLTAKQVENINALIVELEKTKNIEIKKINAQERAANLEAQRETEQMRIALMDAGNAKELATLKARYEKETADLRTKLKTDRDLTTAQRAEINKQLVLMQQQYLKDVEKLNEKARTDELNKELKSIELRKAALTGKERQTTADAMREIEIRRQLELSANRELAEELRQSESEINAKYDAQRKTTADKMAKDIATEQLNIQQELANSEYALMRLSENKKTEIALQMERERLQKQIELNEAANIKMSDEELQILRNKIAKIDKDIEANRKKKSLWERMGLVLTDEEKEGINTSFEYAKSVMKDFLDYQTELANRAVENSQREVDSARDALQAERDARAQGYANNVTMAEKELAAAKAQQRKALKQQQEAQKAQQKLQTVEQAVNMVTATAKIFGTMPIYLAIPAIALMWAAFGVSKIKAKQLESEQYGDGTVELLEGGSHASGHDIDLGVKKDGKRRRAEGGEYLAIINKKMSRKYGKQIPEIIDSLNKGVFAEKYANAYEGGNTVIATFDGKAELKAIAGDLREMNERGKGTIVTYTVDGRIEKNGNVTRIIKK